MADKSELPARWTIGDPAEVAQLLELEDGSSCARAAKIAEERLAELRQRLRDLTRIEGALSTLLAECGTKRGIVSCPLIAALKEGPSRAS